MRDENTLTGRGRLRHRAVGLAAAASLVAALLGGAGSATAASVRSDAPAASGSAGTRPWLPPTPAQWPVVVNASQTPERTVTRGVGYHTDSYQTMGGAQHATVLDADLTDPNVQLGVVESHDVLSDPLDETVSSMADRTGAVAGINGDFFEIYGSGRPEGMVVQNGRLVKSPNPARPWNLVVRGDGSIGIGDERYAGTVTDGAASHAITSVNTVNDLSPNGLERITPDLGGSGTIPSSTVVAGHRDPADAGVLIVDSLSQGVTGIPALAAGTEDLAGAGTAGQWLAANVHAGDRIAVAETISPDNAPQQAISGGAVLVHDGQMAVPLQGGGENNINDPVTGFGVTEDGKHAIVVVFDGHQPEDSAEGLTRPQLAGWMMAHGAYNALLFDSGGSSQMVVRQPGQPQVSVANTPSDGHERPVANGLFFYSTEQQPGPAVRAVPNGGAPLAVLTGSRVPVPGYAVDALGNPAADPVRLSVVPPGLADVSTNSGTSAGSVTDTLTASDTPGTGVLFARAGSARGATSLRVVDKLSSLTVGPAQADLGNGATQQFSVSATTRDGRPVTMLPASVSWSVSPPDLGSVDPDTGLFTAASDGEGLATVTASAGGKQATASLAVGQRAETIDPMTNAANWGLTLHSAAGSLSESTTVKRLPTDAGSLDVHYSIPAGNGVKQVVFYPKTTESFPPAGETQTPLAVGMWIKGTGTGGSGTPLGLGNLTLAEAYTQVNGQSVTFYPAAVTYDGWQLIVADLPAGLQYPLTVSFLDFLVISPAQQLTGDLYVSDLQALYTPRPPVVTPYVPIPDNPKWLQYTESPAQFRPGGTTIAALDDAHTHADDPGSTGSVVLKQDGEQIKALPQNETGPLGLQALGDMSDTGSPANLAYMKSLLDGIGVPYHEAVGNHEITQGADPENKNWTSLFGPTHYAYTQGAANVLVADSAHIGVLASDPYQVPAGDPPQYQWLADQLTANTSPVVFVVTHVPAYDPHAVRDSQFADRWEARMYEALAARYQATHPQVHVILMFGHARGFAENLLDPQGGNVPNGLPNFVVADAGMPPYAPPNQGGFYNYGLFHVLPDGDVQFAVQPTLASLTVTAPSGTLAVGQTVQPTATGTTPTGDDLSALSVPIADPASHVWSSSNPYVAQVDPVTGRVRARHAGTVTITCESDGATGAVTLTVTPTDTAP